MSAKPSVLFYAPTLCFPPLSLSLHYEIAKKVFDVISPIQKYPQFPLRLHLHHEIVRDSFFTSELIQNYLQRPRPIKNKIRAFTLKVFCFITSFFFLTISPNFTKETAIFLFFYKQKTYTKRASPHRNIK